ncbi:MarR family winged helix-turn-helix transcriptional regulator [Aquincola sp. MAHUQ-54]|uniref:MarR family winged helix-turn-helix transcriptional regulator n=1 Tax=Aquincola agrisoli TaxID=3119538 RepID=A0AAW9PXB9_9BURK
MSQAVPQPPRGCTNLKIRQLARLVGRHYEAHAAATGLKNTQYSLLSHVVKMAPVRPGDLAQAMRLDASTLTRNLQPLVAQGWVTLGAGADGRSRLVDVTEAGRAAREQGQKAWKKAQLEVNALLGIERVTALHALIDECIAVLETTDDAHEEGARNE